MKRRSFLKSVSLAGAAASVPLAVSSLASAATPGFVLLRADAPEAGAAFVPVARAAGVACDAESLRVWMDGLHVAPGSGLQRFTLSALFDLPGGTRAPFVAWHHAAGSAGQPLRFVAERATMRGFELTYARAAGAACATQACALTRFDAPLLAPGHYVLASHDGGFVHSGDVRAPLSGHAGVDYLAFRIEPIA